MMLTPARRKLADAVAASLFTDSGAFLAAADLLGRCGLVSRRQRTKTGAEGDPSTAQVRASDMHAHLSRAWFQMRWLLIVHGAGAGFGADAQGGTCGHDRAGPAHLTGANPDNP